MSRVASVWRWSAAVLFAGLTSSRVIHPKAQPGPHIDIQSLNAFDNLYVLSGDGTSSLALAGDDRVVLIDSKAADSTQEVLEAVQSVSDQPITTIINTHMHADHVGGNPSISAATRIVAHANARAGMARMEFFKRRNGRGLPNETVADRLSLFDGADRIDLRYFGRGHTDGDLVVVFPEKHMAFLGDLFQSKGVPIVDRVNGGSFLEFPRTLARVVAELQGIGGVVPSHARPTVTRLGANKPGSVMPLTVTVPWKDVEEYAAFLNDFVAAVRLAREAGQSPAAAASGLTLPERYRSYDREHARAAIEAIYAELEGR